MRFPAAAGAIPPTAVSGWPGCLKKRAGVPTDLDCA
jgi:hypothetical protein